MSLQPEPAELKRRVVERELLLLVFIVAAIYFPRLTSLPTRGEETRWGSVAAEMRATGDYVVPRQQGEPFLSRPPLGSWLIAGAAGLIGRLDLAAVRLPTATAVLLTSILCFVYTRRFAGAVGAFAAGLSYATCVQVLQLGRVAETDCVFALLVSASLLLWHLGTESGWPKALPWIVGYALAAAGTLAKGPQAPVYFAGSAGLYCLATRRWKALIQPSHFVGIAFYLALVAAWHVPFYLELGQAGTRELWSGDVKLRFVDTSIGTIVKHFAVYPLELLACFLPSSFLLGFWLLPQVRRQSGERSPIVFMSVCLLVAFPTVWFTPGAKVRYFLPLFPAMCVFTGLGLDRWLKACPVGLLDALNRKVNPSIAAFLLANGAAMAVLTWCVGGAWRNGAQAGVAAFAAVATMGVVAMLLLNGRNPLERAALLQVAALGLAVAAFHTGPMINVLTARAIPTKEDVAAVRRMLPADVDLVSLGPVHHRFAFFYRDPIGLLDWPEKAPSPEVPPGAYFCFCRWGQTDRLPSFDWDEIVVVNCDRNTKSEPVEQVIVGRRRPSDSRVAARPRPSGETK